MMYGTMQIARRTQGRAADFSRENIVSFGAPVLLLCHFPNVSWAAAVVGCRHVAADDHAAAARGGAGQLPAGILSLYAKLIKDHLGVSDESHIFFCGIAIGYRDEEDPVNAFDRKREPLDSKIKFLGF
jgi:hypothetical protein